jgi:phosphoribosylanthranilate isomerase
LSFLIKVCGITRREDAQAAVDAGATALGFVFYKQSPRYVEPARAAEIAAGLPAVRVGIFVDEPEPQMLAAARAACLDVVQFYGSFDGSLGFGTAGIQAPHPLKLWRAIRVDERFDPATVRLEGAEFILLDGLANGLSFSWPVARQVQAPVVLAGGLDATNVGEAIRQAQPAGVDASSRLEIEPGRKDHRKIHEFVAAALAAAQVVRV